MKRLAIIPARGGSKRIPRKNIKDFLGKPIIAYSIEAALDSELFDEVMVSTDDEEIAEIALNFGAKIPFLRSEESSNDDATLADVITEVLAKYRFLFNYQPSFFCTILSTAPFIKSSTLIDAYQIFSSTQADSLISASSFPSSNSLNQYLASSLKLSSLSASSLNFIYNFNNSFIGSASITFISPHFL